MKDENMKSMFSGKMDKYDLSKKPTFLEFCSFVNENDDNRVSKKLRKRVFEFNSRAFTARVARECWTGIQEQINKGELNEDEFMSKAYAIMESTDESAKMALIQELVKKYSLTGNAFALSAGLDEVPNDISELLG